MHYESIAFRKREVPELLKFFCQVKKIQTEKEITSKRGVALKK